MLVGMAKVAFFICHETFTSARLLTMSDKEMEDSRSLEVASTRENGKIINRVRSEFCRVLQSRSIRDVSCADGSGVFAHGSKMRYKGEWRYGRKHGRGRLVIDGDEYDVRIVRCKKRVRRVA